MKVLFVLPPFRYGRDVLPLGPAYIASMLLKNSHKVAVLDVDAFEYTRKELMQLFQRLDYDVIATGGMATAYKFVKDISEDIKKIRPDVKIITGGHMVTPAPKLILKNSGVDIGVIGEGELTMVELLDALTNNKPLGMVDGIAFKNNGGITLTKPRELIKNLDSLPFPAWDLFFAKEVYTRSTRFSSLLKARKSINISTGRGCPYECTFCSYDRRVRLRSADNIISELYELKRRYKIGSFSIQDELFIVDRKRAVEFCNKLIKSRLNLTWQASGRVNLIDKELLKLFKKAGCLEVSYGIESGSPKVLDRMKKKITPKQIEDAIRWTTEAGLVPGGSWILGMPGEDKESVHETLRLYKSINRYRRYSNRFFFATPYPGTQLYEEMKSMGRIKDEDKYMDTISKVGDATVFVVNCTEAFSDDELIKLKKDLEKELSADLHKKHRILYIMDFIFNISGLKLINKFLIKVKVKGLGYVIRKILSEFTKRSPYFKPYI